MREWLGGFGACGVFASLFLLSSLCLPLFFSFYPAFMLFVLLSLLVLLSSACPLSLWLVVGFLLFGLLFLFPFRTMSKKKGRKGLLLASSLGVSCVALFGCLWNYETIASRFNPERISCYPSHGKLKGIVGNNLVTVSALVLHHHPARIVRACLFGAWLSVCLIKAINVAAVVGVDVCLCFFGVVL